jgi:hypothetical protein
LYLGTSSDGLRSRLSVPELAALGDPVMGGDIRRVDGWLLEGSVLAETKNESLHGAVADDRLPVRLGDRVARANVVPGPFLVRPTMPLRYGPACIPDMPCPGWQPMWQVVAQVDDRPAIWVGSP